MSGPPDLRTQAPRRWNDRIAGILWLARLIDKTRAFEAGTLGVYLLGQSPVDEEFLTAAAVDYQSLREVVRAAPDDAAVLVEIERRSPGATARLQAWSAKPSLLSRAVFTLIDADEGHAHGAARILGLIPQGTYKLTSALLRRIAPLRP